TTRDRRDPGPDILLVTRTRLVSYDGLGELTPTFKPPPAELGVRLALPDAPAPNGLERELRIQVRGRTADLNRPLHRLPQALAVELERVRAPDRVPQPRLLRGVHLELDRPREECEPLVDLVAEIGRASCRE